MNTFTRTLLGALLVISSHAFGAHGAGAAGGSEGLSAYESAAIERAFAEIPALSAPNQEEFARLFATMLVDIVADERPELPTFVMNLVGSIDQELGEDEPSPNKLLGMRLGALIGSVVGLTIDRARSSTETAFSFKDFYAHQLVILESLLIVEYLAQTKARYGDIILGQSRALRHLLVTNILLEEISEKCTAVCAFNAKGS